MVVRLAFADTVLRLVVAGRGALVLVRRFGKIAVSKLIVPCLEMDAAERLRLLRGFGRRQAAPEVRFGLLDLTGVEILGDQGRAGVRLVGQRSERLKPRGCVEEQCLAVRIAGLEHGASAFSRDHGLPGLIARSAKGVIRPTKGFRGLGKMTGFKFEECPLIEDSASGPGVRGKR
jgi:hypothetical protein